MFLCSFSAMTHCMSVFLLAFEVFQHDLFSCLHLLTHSFPVFLCPLSSWPPPFLLSDTQLINLTLSLFNPSSSFGTQQDRSVSESPWCNTTIAMFTRCSLFMMSHVQPASAAWHPGLKNAGRTLLDRRSPGSFSYSYMSAISVILNCLPAQPYTNIVNTFYLCSVNIKL